MARVFDPLGLEAPTTLCGKLFLQKLWKLNQPWDGPMNDELSKECIQIVAMLSEVPNLCIPRFVDSSKKGTNQLLIFSDASTNCYATAVYLRSIDGPLSKTNLIFAKNRLVPLNK